MHIRYKAVLAGILAAFLLFICLTYAVRLPPLIALVLAIFGGGTVLAAVTSKRQSTRTSDLNQVAVEVPAAPVAPPPIQFQVLPITGIRLPSARADYTFAFSANVIWTSAAQGGVAAGEAAIHEIVRRACEVTVRQHPDQVTLIASKLAVALGALQRSPNGQVLVRAESVQLQLPPDDQHRLDELAALRKQEALWEYKRRYQASLRHYLRTDVLKDSGSAIVWWLAKHEDEPEKVVERIDVLQRLASAANNMDAVATAGPQSPADHFDAFLDSLAPVLGGEARLLLTIQMASLVDGHDQKAADEMRRRQNESDVDNGYWDSHGKADDTQTK